MRQAHIQPWALWWLWDRIGAPIFGYGSWPFQLLRDFPMAMSTAEIQNLLSAAFPDAKIAVEGGEGKYQVQIVSDVFAGLNRVKRQQSIYKIVNAHIQSGAIHAINMNLQTPEEAAQA